MHLKRKRRERSPEDYRHLARLREPEAHPIFRIVPGNVPGLGNPLSPSRRE